MGVGLSTRPKTFDNTKFKEGKKPSLKDPVVIQVSSVGFNPEEIIVFSGQKIHWEWESDDAEILHNIKQVTLSDSGQALVPVPHGISSGQVCSSGTFEAEILACGSYYFISEGHSNQSNTTIRVLAAPQETIKVIDEKFEPDFIEINEGESVTWKWESGKRNLKRVEFCFKHGGIIFTNLNPTCDSDNKNIYTYTESFEKPGLYYYAGNTSEQFCIIKVLQKSREYSIRFQENRAEPLLINGFVGDRIWVQQAKKNNENMYMMIKSEDGGILVSSRPRGITKPNRLPSVISYCFIFPGIYRVLSSDGLSTVQCIILVQPKPRDYVIKIGPRGFEPELGSVKQGDRIWWVWNEEESANRGFLIQEKERIANVKKDFVNNKEACRCFKSNEYLSSIGGFGLLSMTADTPGLFTYRMQDMGDWCPSEHDVFFIIVQNFPKNHVVFVSDHGFQPQIVNVHPGESVTWTWRDTNNSHNIQQVSHERVSLADGFHSSFLSPSPDAFSHVFTNLGVFYFTSANMSAVYGAVVVTAGNQVHNVEVTPRGVKPDPLGVRIGDIVCWKWSSDQLYSINAIKSPNEIEKIVETQGVPIQRRCVAATFKATGIHHFASTAYLRNDDQPEIHACGSSINTVYVDTAPYSCRVNVSRDGFQPYTVTLAKQGSVLWSWDNVPDEQHNILLIENPSNQSRIVPVRGPAFFESGPLTSCSSFFHTFDTPGSFWVTSHGTEGKRCRIDVLDEAKCAMPPEIASGSDGGNVELGYTVFLSCIDRDVDILYTLDGSMPAEYLPNTNIYDWQKGIRLSCPGLYVVRAISIKTGWIPSEIFTTRRFWVLDDEEPYECTEEPTMEDNLGLRREITNWQWLACVPTISSSLAFDNSIHINFTLSPNAQASWIAGFQLYMNGQPYGGWLCASCPGVEVSGLTGGKLYHVVVVVFPAREQFSPQLSNELIIKCPTVSSFGGPIVSLETCGRVDALIIMWPAKQGCLYTLLIDGQPMGEQVSAEADNDYCQILFETENVNEERSFRVQVVLEEKQQLVSNEISLSLPLPIEMIQLNGLKSMVKEEEELAEECEGMDSSISSTNVSREVLMISELSVAVIPSRPEGETSLFSPSSPQFQSTLDTIHEDKQLDVSSSPSRPSLECDDEIICEESQMQRDVNNENKSSNSSHWQEKGNSDSPKAETGEVSFGNNNFNKAQAENTISKEHGDQLRYQGGDDNEDKVVNVSDRTLDATASLKSDLCGTNFYEDQFSDKKTSVGSSEGNEISSERTADKQKRPYVNNNNNKLEITESMNQHKIQNTIVTGDKVYGPLEVLSNNEDPLIWECVLSSDCDYSVDYIDGHFDHLNEANMCLVELKTPKTTIISHDLSKGNSSPSSTKNDSLFSFLEAHVDKLVFHSCETCNILVENPWCEYFGTAKDIKCFEKTFCCMEKGIDFCAVTKNKMKQSVDESISPIDTEFKTLQSTSCVEWSEMQSPDKQEISIPGYSEKYKEIPLGISNEGGALIQEAAELRNKEVKQEIYHTDDDKGESPYIFGTHLTPDLTLAVKGASSSSVVLEWEDNSCVVSPVYCLVVVGETFGTDIDSHYSYDFNKSPAPDMWPDNRAAIEQHHWTTVHSVIEIRGLRPRHLYKIAVVVLSRDSNAISTNDTSRDGISSSRDTVMTSLRSEIISFTMPGRPKAPVIYVTALRDREFTISWRPTCSYGDAKVVGYRLQINGKQNGELLPYGAIQHTVSDLQYGTFQHVSLIAVTNHHVGDSTPSNVVTIACPHPPRPPKISQTTATAPHSISITWSAGTAAINPDQLKLLSSYDVYVDEVFHGSCPAGDVTDLFMDTFTYTITGCIVGREYAVKVKGHVDPQTIESSQPAHMCGCYGKPSNTLLIRCYEASVPVLRVESMDESAVHLSWDKPQVEGTRHVTGYIIHVDGYNYGEVHDPNTNTAKLTNLPLGNDFDVTISALTNNIIDAPRYGHHQEQRALELVNEVEVQLHEPHDSGVESSSSVFVDKQSEATLQSAPLTLHQWGFVKKVCEVQVKQVCCCSALLQWGLQAVDQRNQEQRHDVFINPDVFQVKCWKSEEISAQELESTKTSNMDIHLYNLTPLSRYGVVIEAFAHHPNYTKSNDDWNISRSDKIWFDTKPSPSLPQNVRVVSRTLNSICLAWDLTCNDHGSSLKQIELTVYKKYDDENVASRDSLIHLVINSHMTSYTINNLDPKTFYVFTLRTLYNYSSSQNDRQCCSEVVSLEACTSGIDRPHDLRVIKRTPFSLTVAWESAVSYGDLEVLNYVVHYVEKKTRSSQGVVSALKDGKFMRIPHTVLGLQTEILGLEPGAVYNILVEAVVGLREKYVEEEEEDKQINDGDDIASSVGSSESDLLSSVCHDCLSKSLTAITTAPPGIPVLFVTGISATQIRLAWNVPVSLQLESQDRERAERHDFRGRVRQISGYSLEVNGRVVTKLPPNAHSFTLKRCKPGMKYKCYLDVMTMASDSSGKRSKRIEDLFHNKEIIAVGNTEPDSDDEMATSFQEARSKPIEVTIPRQDHPLVINIHYSPTSVSRVSSTSSSGSEETDEGCVVIEWKVSPALKDVASYEVMWRTTLDEASEDNNSLLSTSNSYEIYPVKPRSVYSVWLKMLRKDGSSITWGPLNCQVPGRPDPPWIWSRSVSPHRILVEWNEPFLYGVDTIRAYQVSLNGRQLGKLLSPQNRKVAVHCQPNSVYRIILLALTTDPNLGGSDPSNLLTICTPGVKDKSLDPKQNIRIKPLWAENDSITVEWSDDNDLLNVDHYVVKWSSVLHPQSTERTVPMHQVSYTIEDCKPGTRHFIAVAAIDECGKLVSKSQQLIVQTSAPMAAPKLRLSSALPSRIQVEWDRPIPMGDATVDSYEVKVDDVIRATLSSNELSFEWHNCRPCATYDFQVKVISTKGQCHSNWSEVLSCTCPGAHVPVITRVPTNDINSIHVTWDPPNLFGGASVKSYKVHYLADEEEDITNDFIVNNSAHITHGPLQDTIREDTLSDAFPTLPYWVVLEVNLLPEGCITVFSQSIRTQVAVPPDPPHISVVIIGLEERRALERLLCGLAQIKDRICLKLQSLQNSVVLKGAKQKEAQINKNLATIRNLEVELKNCTQDIKNLSGFVNANVKWTVPKDDSDATVTGYQVLIDGEEQEAPLDKDTLCASLELSASSHDHVITIKALSNHPIGHSAPSNAVTIRAKDFLPFVQFCYFEVHSESSGCFYGENLSHEVQNKFISTHKGCLGKPLPSPVSNVTDVINRCIKPLVNSSGNPQALLFWTIWCHSSLKALEMFMQFSREHNHELDFTTCCVKSDHPYSDHQQSLHDLLASRGWISEVSNVQHTCGCQDEKQRSVVYGQKSGVNHVFGLVGVPTIVLCNKDGYIIWQGRCNTQKYSEYQQFMCHAFSEASGRSCLVPNCSQCSLDHELNAVDSVGFSSRVESNHPSDCFKHLKTKRDSDLEVTGRLSKFRKKKLPVLDHDQSATGKTSLTGLSRQVAKLLSGENLYKNVHLSVLEETENLHRRLHGSHPQYSPQPTSSKATHHQTTLSQRTRPKTTQPTSHNHSKPSLRTNSQKNPKIVCTLTPGRAKSAYGARTSVFKDRFSSSVISTLPSLEICSEQVQPKASRHRSATSRPKQKISVDEFSPI